MKHFGDLLKHQRENKRFTQRELAHLSGLSIETIQIIEERQVLPSKIQMEKLSSVEPLGLTYDVLHEWKAQELQTHWKTLGVRAVEHEKWQCPYRRWDCPCCLWPYSLQCELKESHIPNSD